MTAAIAVLTLKGLGIIGAALLVFLAGHKLGRWSRRHDYADGWDAAQKAERERWEDVTGATYERLLAEVASDPPDVPGNDGWPYRFTNLKAAGERREAPPTEVLMAEAAAQGYTGPQPAVPSVAEVDKLAARYEAAQGPQGAAPYTAEEIRDGRRMWGVHWGAPGEPGHPQDDPRMAATLARGLDEQLMGHRFDEYAPVVGNITDARRSGFVKFEGDVRPELLDAMRRALDPDETPTLAGVVLTTPRPDRTGPDWLEHQLAEMDRDAAAFVRAMDADARSWRLQIAAGRQP